MDNFPTIANVQNADLATLRYWRKHLPDPETDVQRTVIKRMDRRIAEFAGKAEPTFGSPGIADVLRGLFSGFGGK